MALDRTLGGLHSTALFRVSRLAANTEEFAKAFALKPRHINDADKERLALARGCVLLDREAALASPAGWKVMNVLCGWLPRCKHDLMIWRLVGCSLLSGLLMQSA
jgi:hypothetical protein